MIQINLGSDGLFMCGGSLISNRYILTAAHCVSNTKTQASASMITAGVGDNNMTKLMQIPAVSLHIHPNWDPATVKNDIALIEIGAVSFSSSLYPVSLPKGKVPQNAEVYALGWGRTSSENSDISSILKKAQLVTGNINSCVSLNPAAQRNPQALICTINNITRQDTCVGDSGGPLISLNSSSKQINSVQTKRQQPGHSPQQILVGITSFGTDSKGLGDSKCGSDNAVGFYTNVAYFADWIRSIAKV